MFSVWLIILCLSRAVGLNQKWFWYGLILVHLFYVSIWPWWGKWISSHSLYNVGFVLFFKIFQPEMPMVGNDRCNPKSSHLILLLTSFTLNFSVYFLMLSFSLLVVVKDTFWKEQTSKNKNTLCPVCWCFMLKLHVCVWRSQGCLWMYPKRIICWSWFVKI